MIQNSEDILAVRFGILVPQSLEFVPRSSPLVVSRSSVFLHFLLMRTFPKSTHSHLAFDRTLHQLETAP